MANAIKKKLKKFEQEGRIIKDQNMWRYDKLFSTVIESKVSLEQNVAVVDAVRNNPELYYNTSHFVRVAVLKLLRTKHFFKHKYE